MVVSRRHDHTWARFWVRTIAGQIHLLGFLAACVGTVVLVHSAYLRGDPAGVAACLVFGLSGIVLFAVSTTYHFLFDGFLLSAQTELLFEDLDHFSIYCFIAGTYTALLVNVVSNHWQWIMLSLVWTVAVLGMLYTKFKSSLPPALRSRAVYTSLFVILGWVLVIRWGEIVRNLKPWPLFFLFAGGGAYTIGALIYALKKPRLFVGVFGYHELWHVCVLIGALLHYLMILSFY